MINPQKVCRDHGFETVSLAWTERGYWTVWVHGVDVAEGGCAQGRGDTPAQALADVIRTVRVYREDEAVRAATGEDARSRRIAALKAELSTLTGEPA